MLGLDQYVLHIEAKTMVLKLRLTYTKWIKVLGTKKGGPPIWYCKGPNQPQSIIDDVENYHGFLGHAQSTQKAHVWKSDDTDYCSS